MQHDHGLARSSASLDYDMLSEWCLYDFTLFLLNGKYNVSEFLLGSAVQ